MDEKDVPPASAPAPAETLDQLQTRHRKELRDLQSRITQKKKNATKKTRKGVNEECAELERLLKEQQAEEIRRANGEAPPPEPEPDEEDQDDDGLVPAMETVSISSPQPPPQKEKEPGQKQNRHRARLARRAAEAEAAAAAAASEAAAQPDRRASERAAMERAFKENSLREKDIEPDGHCLFSAVADQLGVVGIQVLPTSTPAAAAAAAAAPAYKVVRRTAAEYMTKHADDFAGFLEEPVGEYAARIRDTAEWGGELELSALARAYGVEIRVVQDGRTEVVAPFEDTEEGGEGRKTLWLAYYRYGYGLGEHYNSLRSVKGGN